MDLTLYGIPNCDTVKKARAWLDGRGHTIIFHDYKKAGVDAEALDRWLGEVGWEPLLNRAGTTFRKLDEAARANVDEARARALMLAYPSTIKRPIVEGTNQLLVGFKPDQYEAAGL